MKLKDCANLKEYRIWVLKIRQSEIAKLAGCPQGQISKIETGHLPRPWNWAPLLTAYQLNEVDFERLVLAAKARGGTEHEIRTEGVSDVARVSGGGLANAAS